MRLTGILLLAGFLQVSAGGSAQTVTYAAKAAPLAQVLSVIEQQTGYNVFYNEADLQNSLPVTIQLKATPLREALQMILVGQPVQFDIQGNTISLVKKKAPPVEPASPDLPPGEIHGRVTDSVGTPLSGAYITVKGTKKGTFTNEKGDFSLKGVPADAVLVISNIGYEPQQVSLSGRAQVSVRLNASVTALQDVVINKGYYTEKKRLSTGSVSTVSGEEIARQPVSDFMMALEGRVPGLQISQASGIPGANYTFMLRGKNSIANGINPLFIVDGVPFTSTSLTSPDIGGGAVGNVQNLLYNSSQGSGGLSPFNNLNPADIESVEVLKDADATAIYGSRGANGVILITTKKGKAGQTKVDLDVKSGLGKVTRWFDLLNTPQYLEMRREAFKNDGLPIPSVLTDPTNTDYDINGTWDTTRYTNWQKLFIGNTAHFNTANISISGGNANTQFLLGGAYSNQTTVFPGKSYDQKASGHLNLNHLSGNRKFHTQFTAQYGNDINFLPQADFAGSVTLAPDAPAPYDANGKINFQNGTFYNPLGLALQTSKAVTGSLLSSLNVAYDILPGLKLQSNFGYTHMQMNQDIVTPAAAFYGPPNPYTRYHWFATTNANTWIVEPQLNYNLNIGKGKLDLLAGSTIQQNLYNTVALSTYGYSSDELIQNIANSSLVFTDGNSNSDYRYNALYGRLNYNWDDKYIVNATGRRDGSSRFGPGKQFGNFGALGIAWIFSKENFIEKTLPFLSFGKLQASYGTTGNDQISDYQYLSSYSSSGNYQNTSGLAPNKLANAYFAWEVVNKLQGGLALGFLKDRITIDASYFRNRSGNQLIGQQLPSIDGFTSIQSNLPAVVQNTGLELQFTTRNIESHGFSWKTSFNITVPRNKLVSFANLSSNPSYANFLVIGQSIYHLSAYHYTGVDPQTGLYTVQDLNKDGQISYLDYQTRKEIAQNYFGGFDNNFSFKGLQLDVFFQYVKQTGKRFLANGQPPGFSNANQSVEVLKRWQKPGDQTDIGAFTTGANYQSWGYARNSDWSVTNTSYIRLKNVSLSYTLPQAWQRSAHLQNTRLYIEAQNLLTITSFKGADPETGGYSLPPLRMITFGIQVSL